MAADSILGIHLGLHYATMTRVWNGAPAVVPDGDGALRLASTVGLVEPAGRLRVGAHADDPSEQQVTGIGHLLGRRYDDPYVQSLIRQGLAHGIISSADGGIQVWLGAKLYSPAEIVGLILHRLKAEAGRTTGQAFTRAVLTLPIAPREPAARRRLTAELHEAAHIAGFYLLAALDEPLAAALAFGIHRSLAGASQASPLLALVYQLESSSFDATVLAVANGQARVIRQETHRLTVEADEPTSAACVEYTVRLTLEALAATGATAAMIDDVLLVGERAADPLVWQALAAAFGAPKLRRDVDPRYCLALGAGVEAARLTTLQCGTCDATVPISTVHCPTCAARLDGGPRVSCPACDMINVPSALACRTCSAALGARWPDSAVAISKRSDSWNVPDPDWELHGLGEVTPARSRSGSSRTRVLTPPPPDADAAESTTRDVPTEQPTAAVAGLASPATEVARELRDAETTPPGPAADGSAPPQDAPPTANVDARQRAVWVASLRVGLRRDHDHDVGDVVDELYEALGLWPDDAPGVALSRQALAILQARGPGLALAVVRVAEMFVHEPGVVDLLARVYAEAGRLEDIVRLRRKLLELSPEDDGLRRSLAHALQANLEGLVCANRWPEASAQLEEVLDLDGSAEVRAVAADVRRQQGNRLAADGKWPEAVAMLELAQETSPTVPVLQDLAEVSSAFAERLAGAGQWEEAIKHRRRAYALTPTPDLEQALALAYATEAHRLLRHGDPNRAREYANEALKLDPLGNGVPHIHERLH